DCYGFCYDTLTSALLVLVMVMIWKTNIFFIITYVLTIYLFKLLLLSSVMYKFVEGGYLPLVFFCDPHWSHVHMELCVPKQINKEEAEKAVQLVDNECQNGGVVYLRDEIEVVASKGSGFRMRVMIDYAYNFLNRCVRQDVEVFAIGWDDL
ncbi:hypothetical protein IFM89_020563, partial [Coptis chinensis]